MTWPDTGTLATTHIDAGGDDPAQARPTLKTALDEIEEIKGARGTADGIASLDGDALIPTAQLPVVPISKGGTGATDAGGARSQLGAQAALGYTPVNKAGDSMTGALTMEALAQALLTILSTASGAEGVNIQFGQKSGSPAVNDEPVIIDLTGRIDPTSAQASYVRLKAVMDAIGASRNGKLVIQIAAGGTLTDALTLAYVGSELRCSLNVVALTKLRTAASALEISGDTIASGDGTDGNIVLAPDGTGVVNVASKLNAQAGAEVTGLLEGQEIQIDNINIDGNQISSTNTNGDIDIVPDGTGVVNITQLGTMTRDDGGDLLSPGGIAQLNEVRLDDKGTPISASTPTLYVAAGKLRFHDGSTDHEVAFV
jgi:hypothetical protein